MKKALAKIVLLCVFAAPFWVLVAAAGLSYALVALALTCGVFGALFAVVWALGEIDG